MLRILIIGIVVFFAGNKTIAQNEYIQYYQLVNDAHDQYDRDNLDSAMISLKEAFDLVDYVHVKNLKFGKKVARKFGDQEFLKFCTSGLKSSKESIDHELQLKIQNILNEDQRVRSSKYWKAHQYYYTCTKDANVICDEDKLHWSRMMMEEWWNVDSMNIIEVKELIASRGYPSEEMVGRKHNQLFGTIILHYDKDTSNHIMGEILYTALKEGAIMPEKYGSIIDRHLLMGGQSQKYYTEPHYWIKMSKGQREEYNRNRNAIGMSPFDDSKIIVKKNRVIVKN